MSRISTWENQAKGETPAWTFDSLDPAKSLPSGGLQLLECWVLTEHVANPLLHFLGYPFTVWTRYKAKQKTNGCQSLGTTLIIFPLLAKFQSGLQSAADAPGFVRSFVYPLHKCS